MTGAIQVQTQRWEVTVAGMLGGKVAFERK